MAGPQLGDGPGRSPGRLFVAVAGRLGPNPLNGFQLKTVKHYTVIVFVFP